MLKQLSSISYYRTCAVGSVTAFDSNLISPLSMTDDERSLFMPDDLRNVSSSKKPGTGRKRHPRLNRACISSRDMNDEAKRSQIEPDTAARANPCRT
jgi:hypothetical protein